MPPGITPRQLKKLQTLWGHHWRLSTDIPLCGNPAASREGRIAWLSESLGRAIATSKELTKAEAAKAIQALMMQLPEHLRGRKRRMSGQRAHELGTAGRRGVAAASTALPGAQELAAIESLKAQLGWDNVRFDAWLRSRYSPVRGMVRTLADANRVRWALKAIVKRQGGAAA
ncbi:MAG: hypothetical protein ACLP1Y_17060 [Candidatus Acidiferrales bacterium]